MGKSLVDGAISWLEEHGCEVIYATADRYNSPSWNMFVHRGLHLYQILQRLRDYGLSFLRLWLGEFHFIGYGTFFLRRNKETKKSPLKQEKRGIGWVLCLAYPQYGGYKYCAAKDP